MPATFSTHAALTLANIHTIARWNHADSTARLAETVAAEDVGKVSHQLVDDTFYVLADVIPTWVLLG